MMDQDPGACNLTWKRGEGEEQDRDERNRTQTFITPPNDMQGLGKKHLSGWSLDIG